jgi:hypothetical protein
VGAISSFCAADAPLLDPRVKPEDDKENDTTKKWRGIIRAIF